MLLKFKEEVFEFLDENRKQLKQFPIEERMTFLVGVNNSGKSRLLRKLFVETNLTNERKGIYIPILRNMRPLSHTDLFKAKTIQDYFHHKEIPFSDLIVTGQDFYHFIDSKYNGEENDRILLRECEEYLGKNLFGEEVRIIPRHNYDTVFIKIGNEVERPIYDLGDGVFQILLILVTAYLNIHHSLFFFIEEPETNLHPMFASKLMSLLKEDVFHHLNFVFTTHQVELIKESSDDLTKIYQLQDVTEMDENKSSHANQFMVCAKESHDLFLLKSLGVNPSSYLVSSSIIWVEGPTDIPYIRALLSDTTYVETLDYSIMTYSGHEIMKLNKKDLTAFSKSNLFIADGDIKQSKEKMIFYRDLENKLGKDSTYILDCTEIENIMDPSDFINLVEDHLKLKDIRNDQPFDFNTFRTQRLGQFLSTYYQGEGIHQFVETNKLQSKFKVDLSKQFYQAYLNKKIKLTEDMTMLKSHLVKFIKQSNEGGQI